MAEQYRFFDSVEEVDERSYSADEFAEYFRQLLTDGILNGGDNLEVSADTGLDVNVNMGYAWIQGYLYKNADTPLTLTHDAGDATHNRIDRIVVRLDLSNENRYVRAFVKKGTPAASPSAPTLTRAGNIYEISLATVLIPQGAGTVSTITDERFDNDVCGLVNSLIQVDASTLLNALEAEWQAWFDALEAETYVTNAQFDAVVNAETVQIGEDADASGSSAIAIGKNAEASEQNTIAIGNDFTKATGIASKAVGYNAQASGVGAIAFGVNSRSNGEAAIAIGSGANASAVDGIAIGRLSEAVNYGIAIGYNAEASTILATDAVAIGKNAVASGQSSVAIGTSAQATSLGSIAIGVTATNIAAAATVVGWQAVGRADYSVCLGYAAETYDDTCVNSVAIGRAAVAGVANVIKLGKSSSPPTVQIPGNCAISGSLSKGSGTFKITHPLDAKKHLIHGFVEAPRYDLIYRGIAKLENGIAEIDIDTESNMTQGTFQALTQNAVVTSLCNQTGFAKVKPSKVVDGKFTVECEDETATDEIAWVVIAERADEHIINNTEAWTDENGHLIPEWDKKEEDLLEDKVREAKTDEEAKQIYTQEFQKRKQQKGKDKT